MWWKTYFWFNLVTFFGGYIFILSKTTDPKIGDLVGLLINGAAVLGLYVYSYKKRIFSHAFWRSFFWIYLTFIIILKFYPYLPLENFLKYSAIFTPLNDQYKTSLIGDLMIYLLAAPIIFPAFYALYKLGSNKKN